MAEGGRGRNCRFGFVVQQKFEVLDFWKIIVGVNALARR
jgi:hypothetical protein